MDDKRKTIKRLLNLAERPGTPAEGETARRMADSLMGKYGLTERDVEHALDTKPRFTYRGPFVALSQILYELRMDPKTARAKLRRSPWRKRYGRWVFYRDEVPAVKKWLSSH